ncbi:MAG: hypothetical protein EOR07_11620 [Mesorhizobium sp.]|nr:MAG: hypothetical protein EOR07_11620 [Mesorhizobium sp.]
MLPQMAQVAFAMRARSLRRLLELEDELRNLGQGRAGRLAAVPGIGGITATALLATVSDSGQFRSGRQFAAWLGFPSRTPAVTGNVSAASRSRETADFHQGQRTKAPHKQAGHLKATEQQLTEAIANLVSPHMKQGPPTLKWMLLRFAGTKVSHNWLSDPSTSAKSPTPDCTRELFSIWAKLP